MKHLCLFPLILIAGCTSTRLTTSWTAPNAGAYDYKKILVVSIIQNEDSSMRQQMESHLVNDLKAMGYNAVAYNQVFKPGELRNMRYDSVRKKLIGKGIDGVVTIELMATETEKVYVKDKESIYSQNLPLGNFWERPKTEKQEIGKSSYYLSSTYYYWKSHFYDVSTISLLYSAQSAAFEVSSTESMAHKYGKMIAADMHKNYLLTAR